MSTDWYKSSFSSGTGENCVECRAGSGQILIRDTQNRSLGHIEFPVTDWQAFVAGLKCGEL